MHAVGLIVSLLLCQPYGGGGVGLDDLENMLERKFYKPDSRWHAFGFRWFDRMENPAYRSYKYGFPPGIYGSSIIPITMWFHLWCFGSVEDMYLQSHNVHLVTLDYNAMIQSCNETELPRCSWHLFVALYQPNGYREELLDILIKDHKRFVEKDCYPVPITQGSCYPFTSIDQMSLIYIYHVCHMFKPEDARGLHLEILCPNPCGRRPCKSIDAAIPGSCESYGFHVNDFTCKCEQGYEWENSTMLCSIDDNCGKICHESNTMDCIVNRTSATAICRCKDGFMGFDCSQKYDACVLGKAPDARGLNVGPVVPSGYEACGATLDARNLCFSIPNTTTYACVCSPAYVRDVALPYDNCLKPLDSCDKRICVHGQCVTSPDLLKSACDCDEGYTGSLCDQTTGSWSHWSEWSNCEPTCGPVRHRRRLRMCMSENEGDCIGPVEEVRQCVESSGCFQDVPVEEETWLDFVDWTNYVMMITLGYIGSWAILLSLIGLCRRVRPKQQLKDKGEKMQPVGVGSTGFPQ
ncbi:hypothetical protein CRM22_011045 [Opisthorchis felineus]|uniref:EGF-like domain-containing protein n=1 Tax=Opisthorchis felineus TaxID=147828 RepID=A0A4S2KHE0_OPIFE|nr:hypothetical protein CRM22_011045 [Opisthorchis felineus]